MKSSKSMENGEIIFIITACLIILFGFVWGGLVQDQLLIERSTNILYLVLGLMFRSLYVQT
jgi:hypothetical protein